MKIRGIQFRNITTPSSNLALVVAMSDENKTKKPSKNLKDVHRGYLQIQNQLYFCH